MPFMELKVIYSSVMTNKVTNVLKKMSKNWCPKIKKKDDMCKFLNYRGNRHKTIEKTDSHNIIF